MGRRGVAVLAGVLGVVLVTGCAARKSSLLLERQARGPMNEEGQIAESQIWTLDPPTQTLVQGDIQVTVTYASPQYLRDFFDNRQVFGTFAGMNPFFNEQMVFYVQVTNHSGKKILIDPARFVMIDDKQNQYSIIGADYGNALAETKQPLASLTRGMIDEAKPGYFGVGVPVGKLLPRSQRRFGLLKMASLQPGLVYDGVTYDGMVAFWSPHEAATSLTLVVGDVKTDYGPDDLPKVSKDFTFKWSAKHPTK